MVTRGHLLSACSTALTEPIEKAFPTGLRVGLGPSWSDRRGIPHIGVLDRVWVDIYRQPVYKVNVAEVREPTFLVLVALADGRRHGYGIIQDVERLSNGKTKLRAGTLYATLDRLTADGLIEEAGEEVVDGRFRRYYRLARRGSAVLETESKQRLVVSKEALRRLRVAGAFA